MQYTPSEKDIKIEQGTPETLDFKDILLTKRKKKKSSQLSASKAISKKYKKIRQKKNDELKVIKQVPLHPRDRLACKVKNITSDNDKTFIKQVPLHPPRDSFKRLTKDINDDMSRINYADDDVNIDDLSDAETVNYTNNATVKISKSTMQFLANKIRK